MVGIGHGDVRNWICYLNQPNSIKDKWLLFHNPPTGSILNKIGIKEWGMAVWNWAYKEGDKYVRMYKYLMKKDKSNDRSTG